MTLLNMIPNWVVEGNYVSTIQLGIMLSRVTSCHLNLPMNVMIIVYKKRNHIVFDIKYEYEYIYVIQLWNNTKMRSPINL